MAPPHPALLHLAAGRPLPSIADPDGLVRSAIEHRMGGLLWSRVLAGDVDLPPEQRVTLARADVLTRNRHRRLWEGLTGISALLGERGIGVVAVKGVAAEARWYDRTGERPCSDLDLFVAPQHRCRVAEIVEVLQPGHPLAAQVQALADGRLLRSIELRTSDRVDVDLHVDLLKYGLAGPDHLFWERTVEMVAPDGTPVRALDAEASLVHFLVHLTKDRFRHLLGYVDVVRLLERARLDHDAIDRLVATGGLDLPYRMALRTVVETLDIDHPMPSRPRDARSALWRIVWRPSVRLQGDLGVVRFRSRQLWLPFTVRGRTIEALRWLRRELLPPAVLLDHRRPGTGPYLWRLMRGRVQDAFERRRATVRLLRGESKGRSRAAAPMPAAGSGPPPREAIAAATRPQAQKRRHRRAS